MSWTQGGRFYLVKSIMTRTQSTQAWLAEKQVRKLLSSEKPEYPIRMHRNSKLSMATKESSQLRESITINCCNAYILPKTPVNQINELCLLEKNVFIGISCRWVQKNGHYLLKTTFYGPEWIKVFRVKNGPGRPDLAFSWSAWSPPHPGRAEFFLLQNSHLATLMSRPRHEFGAESRLNLFPRQSLQKVANLFPKLQKEKVMGPQSGLPAQKQ